MSYTKTAKVEVLICNKLDQFNYSHKGTKISTKLNIALLLELKKLKIKCQKIIRC